MGDKEVIEDQLSDFEVEEPPKDWEPELYDRMAKKKIDYDSAGRRITPITEEESNQTKTQSFLNNVQDVFKSTGVKTIEREVDDLQK